MNERRWHNIRRNELTRLPLRHIFVDTEATKTYERGVEHQRWRCAVAIYATRRRDGKYTQDGRDYVDVERLWRDVSDFTSGHGRTILWCHNLAYDVRIASVFQVLPSLGWALGAHNITPRGTWIEWRRDGATLILCDSFSVFPAGIEQIGIWFGIGKPPLPPESAGMDDWLNRCRSDCRILATAVIAYLEWLKDADMGNWQVTGNGQAWAAYRHKFLTHKLTVHSETDVLALERRAMWAGRCEAYWHGKLNGITVYEYDFQQAYPRIARDREVPVKYVGVIEHARDCWRVINEGKAALLVECEIETSEPVVPAEVEGRILWPVGRFQTVLWDVEVLAAVKAGAHVMIKSGRAYRTAPAMAAWGEWIMAALAAGDEDVPPWLKAILKQWSRSIIGRMAMTYQSWEYDGEMPESRVEAGFIWDDKAGEEHEYIQIGTTMWLHAGKVEWQHSMPMITGYVQAVARVQLWDVMSAMPKGSVLYADTDSVFVTEIDKQALDDLITSGVGAGMRLKNAYESMEIYGPRQIITGPQVRIAGIPKKAERIEKQKFRGTVWESIGMALTMGRDDIVQVRDREWRIAGVDNRRKATENGFTEPIKVGCDED